MQDRPLGIFDSGIGGLTVLDAVARLLPQEDLIYLGDTARVPYGSKSPETVTRYSLRNVRFLLDHDVKMVVVACNTASAFSLSELQKTYDIPILGVITPGAQGAIQASPSGRIGVIGTEGTVRSGAYAREVKKLKIGAQVTSRACPLFVPLVEEGWWEGEVTETVARTYLQDLLQEAIDTLILGCTHYPLLKDTLQKVAGPSVRLIDSAEETARQVAEVLKQSNLLRHQNTSSRRQFFVTDSADRFEKLGALFLKAPLTQVEHVSIES